MTLTRIAAGAALVAVIGLVGCSGTSTKRSVLVDPVAGAWEAEFPGDVTTQTEANAIVYSARYGRDYYGVVDATVLPGLVTDLDDAANNAIDSSRDAIGSVATDRTITPTTIDGYEARLFTAELASGDNSATLTGVVVERNGHVISALITDGLSNSPQDVEDFIKSFVVR